MKYKASALQLAVTFDSYLASPLTRPPCVSPIQGLGPGAGSCYGSQLPAFFVWTL